MGSYPVHIPSCRSRGCAQTVVLGHTRSGADGGVRIHGLDPGKVALYQLSYIRKSAKQLALQIGRCNAANS